MRTTINSFLTFTGVAMMIGGAVWGQNSFQLVDANPTEVDVQRSQLQRSQRPNQLPPIHSPATQMPATNPAATDQAAIPQTAPPAGPSIFDNNLRSDAQQKSNQPLQPRRTNSGFARQPAPPAASHARDTNFGNAGQNPLTAMNPARLPQDSRLAPATTDAKASSFEEPKRFSASAIPSTAPSSRRSILNPISDKKDSSQIIVAAGFENEAPSAGTQTRNRTNQNRKTAKSIMAEYSIANAGQALPGVPTSLEDMLRTTDSNARLPMVQQYWETYFDWATLQNRQRYEQWLNKLPTSRLQTDALLLQTAKSMAKNETLAAEIQLARSQSLLQELASANPNEMLPLPLNDPVTSKYITHYQWYATRRMVPPKLKGINEMLPRTHQLLNQRAATIGQAEQARNQTLQAFSAGQTGIASVLESGRAWQAALQSLVSTTISYNKAISDYALTITPTQKPVAEIASMLVSKPKAISADDMPAPVSRPSVANNQPFGRPNGGNGNGNSNRLGQSYPPSTGSGPQAIGPNAGVFQKSQANQSPAIAPSTRLGNSGNPSVTPNPGNGGADFRPPSRNFPDVKRSVNGQPTTNGNSDFANPTTGNAPNSNRRPMDPRNQAQGTDQFRPGNQPTSGGSNSSQSFGGGGGAFGGG